ncbi:MAG: AAA family ATPase [Halorhodospira halophila]|uniref:AAA family ATPase n=1 Tax=Halorhodospira halophila TaxID=1053 RepID=UPI0026EE7F6E|nr:AAA family ATPase [Halorhodospira halophila]MCC3751076.1 AAA family ATPase [Halorhodospira halophila]
MSPGRGPCRPTLELRCLGEAEVLLDGVALTGRFDYQKQLALFIYLVLETPDGCSRTRLARLFWPRATEQRARASLRTALSRLRRLFADAAVNPLIIERSRVRLSPHVRVICDVDWLWRETPRRHAPATVGVVRHALNLYRGAFLEGIALLDCDDFEDFLQGRRRLYRERAAALAVRLAEVYAARGDHREAVWALQRASAMDPRQHRLRARIGHLLGSGAAEPAESPALARSSQHRSDDVPAQPAGTGRQPAELRGRGAHAGDWREAVFPAYPLQGRGYEAAKLLTRWQRVLTGQGELGTLVVGEAGIGKSRLIEWLHERVHEHRGQWWVLHCDATPGGWPLEPLQRLVAWQARVHAGMSWAQAEPRLIRWLARHHPGGCRHPDPVAPYLLGELLGVELPGGRPAWPPTTQERRQQLGRLFSAVFRRDLGVLVVEGLPEADAATRDWLRGFLRRQQRASAPVMVVATARTEEACTEIQQYLPALRLERLSRSAALRLATCCAAGTRTPMALRPLLRRSAGVPGRLLQLACVRPGCPERRAGAVGTHSSASIR